ncbi:hypothetical protein [Kiloniella sp.]|uniref:hypothetical protein n=1 Tax=Kiloniella sp. TaxID=1938587 RepID=UPI003B02CF34
MKQNKFILTISIIIFLFQNNVAVAETLSTKIKSQNIAPITSPVLITVKSYPLTETKNIETNKTVGQPVITTTKLGTVKVDIGDEQGTMEINVLNSTVNGKSQNIKFGMLANIQKNGKLSDIRVNNYPDNVTTSSQKSAIDISFKSLISSLEDLSLTYPEHGFTKDYQSNIKSQMMGLDIAFQYSTAGLYEWKDRKALALNLDVKIDGAEVKGTGEGYVLIDIEKGAILYEIQTMIFFVGKKSDVLMEFQTEKTLDVSTWQ